MDYINENIIEGQTKSGIRFKIDKRVKEDTRTLFYMRKLRKYKAADLEDEKKAEKAEDALDALYALLELIFGGEEGFMIFMNEVAAHHNGLAAPAVMMEELNDIMEACELKNSSSSQT